MLSTKLTYLWYFDPPTHVFGSLISGDTAENVFGRLIPTRLDRRSYQPTTCLNPRNFFLPRCLICSLPLVYRIFDLLLVVVFFSLCNILLSVSRAAPLTLKNKLVNDSGLFYVWTASLICLSIIKRITASVKRKTDLKLFCDNHPGCVCSVNYQRFIQNKAHLVKH